jgi:hypothetical protein
MNRLFYQNLTLAVVVILSATLSPSYAFKQSDLEQLLRTKQCPRCNLSGVDFEGNWHLVNANLEKANLAGANLTGIDLTGHKGYYLKQPLVPFVPRLPPLFLPPNRPIRPIRPYPYPYPTQPSGI